MERQDRLDERLQLSQSRTAKEILGPNVGFGSLGLGFGERFGRVFLGMQVAL